MSKCSEQKHYISELINILSEQTRYNSERVTLECQQLQKHDSTDSMSPFVCLNLSSKIKLKTLYILLKSTAGLDVTDALDEPAATA